MNKKENNKLIAEFMGVEPQEINKEYEMYGVIECIDDGENEQHFFHPKEMLFHTSWDWLMPVVQECYKSDNEELFDELVDSVSTLSIINTYNSVVEFIKANKKESK